MGWGWGGGGLAQPLTMPLACRYHTGSLAFGALILAIVQIIRVMLEYLDQRLKGEAQMLWALTLNWGGRTGGSRNWFLLDGKACVGSGLVSDYGQVELKDLGDWLLSWRGGVVPPEAYQDG